MQRRVPDLIEFREKSVPVQAQTHVSQDSSLRHSSHFTDKKPETRVLGLAEERGGITL